MPGTFYDTDDERAFVETLERTRPRVAIWPHRVFDDMSERSLGAVAPLVVDWVNQHYRRVLRTRYYSILVYNEQES
jgi:hypothetical protein